MNNQENNDEIVGLLRGIRNDSKTDSKSNGNQDSYLQSRSGGIGKVNVPSDRSALESTFTATPEKSLAGHEAALSKWQRFFFSREIGKLRKEEALKFSEAMYEREFEAVIQKLTLSLDIEKKRTFIQYMRSTAGLQRELQQLDAAARLSLFPGADGDKRENLRSYE